MASRPILRSRSIARGIHKENEINQSEPIISDLLRGPGLSVAFVATCPPRQCGIATFASDLEGALIAADDTVSVHWAAINEPTSIHAYGPKVQWRIRQGDPESYREVAHQLNAARV